MLNLFKADVLRYYSLQGIDKPSIAEWGALRYCLVPRLTPVFLVRLSLFCAQKDLKFFAKLFSMLNFVLFGIEVGTQVTIGPGLVLPHTSGIVIGATIIGKNATIYQGVTLGALDLDFSFDPTKRPRISDNVIIASGAKVLGGITVGQNSVVAANAVVVKDVPVNVVVGGVPAAVIREM